MTNVKDYGAAGDGSTDDTSAIQSALTAADAAHDFLYFPPGVYLVPNGLSLSGHSAAIHGAGALRTSSSQQGTVFKATAQNSKPVLDFTGFKFPDSHRGRITVGGFSVQGDGTSDPTKANSGISVPAGESVNFTDIAIEQTGGPGLDIGRVYLSDFNRITIVTPVNASANDVPYLRATATNGCRFIGIGLRSMGPATAADVGVSGALVVQESASYEPERNLWLGCWAEFLHVPSGGTIVLHRGGDSIIDSFQFFDCGKLTGATGTAYFRFQKPAVNGDNGGNQLRGVIPGQLMSTTTTPPTQIATAIDVGVDMQHSRNSVFGVKGFNGTNVQLASGVEFTTVLLTGSESQTAGATTPAVVDSSGKLTNTIIDLMGGLFQLPQAATFKFGSDTTVQRAALGTVNVGKLAVSNAGSASTLGTVVHKIQVYDASGNSLGYLPVVSESS